MANKNCLEGIKCPECGNEQSFRIDGRCTFRVTDDGSEAVGDHEWGDHDLTQCDSCDCSGPLRDFRIENRARKVSTK